VTPNEPTGGDVSLFLIQGRCPISQEPTPEFLAASKDTLERLGELQAAGTVRAGGVMIGPLGIVFVAECADNDALHLLLTTLPSFRFADWDVLPLIPFHRDIEMSLDGALARAREAAQ
jgi:muconolactone delta-isomerase